MTMSPGSPPTFACPLPSVGGGQIVLAHGGGMRLTQRLLEEVFYPAFGNEALDARHDGAALTAPGGRLAFTTDSYVVHPLFFPGGSIGDLAVYGTVNDLAMCGARPLALSAGFILEEGLPIDVLKRVVSAMQEAATRARVRIVTGDTKVVERGKAMACTSTLRASVSWKARPSIHPASSRATPSWSAAIWARTASPSWRRGSSWEL
jgi:hydrogenase expression/formation protein HypE